MEDQYFELNDRITALIAELDENKAQLAEANETIASLRKQLGKPAVEEDEPLKEYDSLEEVVWEHWPVSALNRPEFSDLAMRYSMGFIPKAQRETGEFMPFKNVLVNGRELRYACKGWNPEKQRGGWSMDDWYAIARHRVPDVLAPHWGAWVQEGDDSFESDPEDMEQLVREYNGGFRHGPETWQKNELGKKLLQIYLDSHGGKFPKPGTTKAPISVAPVPGNIT